MKILNTTITDDFIALLRKEGLGILNDIDRFEEGINSFSPSLMDEAYLMVEGVKMRLFEILLVGGNTSRSHYMQAFKIYMHIDEAEALFMLSVFSQILERVQYRFEIANIDDVEAQLRANNLLSQFDLLAFAYYEGQGVDQDYIKAYELFEEMVDEGNLELYYYLGYMNEYGLGTEEDIAMARTYYKKGSDLQNDACLYALGRLELSLNETEAALKHLKRSKDTRASYTLYTYYLGEGDLQQAFQSALSGALKYDADCMYEVGRMYAEGIGTLQDDTLALKYLTYAYYCFHQEATKELSRRLSDGSLHVQDEKLAADLRTSYEKAKRRKEVRYENL